MLGIFVCKSILQKPTRLQRLLRSQKEVCHENRLCARIDSGTEFGPTASRSEEIELQANLSGESIQHRAQKNRFSHASLAHRHISRQLGSLPYISTPTPKIFPAVRRSSQIV